MGLQKVTKRKHNWHLGFVDWNNDFWHVELLDFWGDKIRFYTKSSSTNNSKYNTVSNRPEEMHHEGSSGNLNLAQLVLKAEEKAVLYAKQCEQTCEGHCLHIYHIHLKLKTISLPCRVLH